MIRGFNIMLAIASLVALTAVYALKYQSVDVAAEKMALERQIEAKENLLSLRKADWAYLNQPARIEPIVLRHAETLGLQQIEQTQFMSLKDIPMRPPAQVNDAALTELLEALEQGVDPISALIEANQ